MKLHRRLALALALACAPVASVAAADDTALEKLLVESASTPAQHKALAEYYKAKAAGLKEEADRHRSMAKSYSGTKLTAAQAMREHCTKLASLADEQAAEYEKMAAMHEAAGK